MSLDVTDLKNETPLHLACGRGDFDRKWIDRIKIILDLFKIERNGGDGRYAV